MGGGFVERGLGCGMKGVELEVRGRRRKKSRRMEWREGFEVSKVPSLVRCDHQETRQREEGRRRGEHMNVGREKGQD